MKMVQKKHNKKINNGMSETEVFLFTVIPHFGLNRNEHNSNDRRLYKYLHGGQCTKFLPEMGHLGSHISQHLGRQIKIRKVNKHKMFTGFSPNDLLLLNLILGEFILFSALKPF